MNTNPYFIQLLSQVIGSEFLLAISCKVLSKELLLTESKVSISSFSNLHIIALVIIICSVFEGIYLDHFVFWEDSSVKTKECNQKGKAWGGHRHPGLWSSFSLGEPWTRLWQINTWQVDQGATRGSLYINYS